MDAVNVVIGLVIAVVFFAFGSYLGNRRGAHVATDYTLAMVAMTFYVTYGEDWWVDFLDEMAMVKKTEHDAVHALFNEIQKARLAK